MMGVENLSVGQTALRSLKRDLRRTVLIDCTALKRNVMSAAKLLAAAAYVADKLKKLPEERIGIALPPGAGGWVANLAVALAGKSSVNVNFTVSREVAEKSLRAAGVRTLISAQAMRDKTPNFPWPAQGVWDLKEMLTAPGAKAGVIAKLLQTLLFPAFVLEKIWGVKKQTEEATLLFTSGSTGEPKGIPLTHRNILSNLGQIEAIALLPRDVKLLANLPLFHSFGLTVTLWYSLTHPMTAVSYTSPLEPHAVAEVVSREKVTGIVSTPSFFQLYLRQVPVEKFKSLEWVVAGAEKTPSGLHEKWKQHFGSEYLEGYGLTETSPVVSTNLPGHNRIGTVGRPLKNLQVRVTDIDTGEVLTQPGAQGVLEFKGPNVFGGYLNEPELNTQMIKDGWLWTGDVGSVDAEGYLRVEGRLKRFSKIAGEMVPHGAVEEAILKVLGWQNEERPPLAVAGAPDEHKGEHLVVVSARELQMGALREKLQAAGLPNLWIPKRVVRVEEIALLPSGKLDLQKLQAAARQV